MSRYKHDYDADFRFIVMVALGCFTLWVIWEYLL